MRLRTRFIAALAASSAVAVLAPVAHAQMLDEGVFTISVNGQRVGREVFSIKRTPVPGGFNIVAAATVTLGDRRLLPQLTADTTGELISYGLEIRDRERIVTQIRGDVQGGHYTQQQSAPGSGGQSHKELRLAPGTVVLDDDVVHQLYFLARRRAAGRVPVFVPQRVTSDVITIAVRGTGPVEVLSGTVSGATHLTLTDGAGTVSNVWVDAAGRVLRVEIAARHFLAERDEAPR